MYFKPVYTFAVAAIFAISLTGNTYANQEQQLQQSEIILTVSEQKTLGNDDSGSAAFSIDMLHALPRVTFETTTIWTEGPHVFTGVSLSALLAHTGLLLDESPQTLHAIAANDYIVSFPVPAVDEVYPIIAYEMDGEPMSLREKGPLWIVYPFDTEKQFRTETVYSRSIWQLVSIELSK